MIDTYMFETKHFNHHAMIENELMALSKITVRHNIEEEFQFNNETIKLSNSYYVHSPHGLTPKKLFISLIHGNEWKTFLSLSKYIRNNISQMPGFIFIPLASQSATGMESEHNVWGNNTNRGFNNSDKILDPDVFLIKKIINEITDEGRNKLDAVYSFHMDWERNNQYYLYEQGASEKINLQGLRRDALRANVFPFTGIDDQNDPQLNHFIWNGFFRLKHQDGMFEDYIIDRGFAPTVYTFESPFMITDGQMDRLTEAYFKNVIDK